MLKKMNLPNKLTILRIILVPIFVVFMCLPQELVWSKYVALGVFVLAAFTDFLDGYISRKNDLVTRFGKIMDPLADKLLVSSGFILLAALGTIPAWMAVLVVFRDFFVNALRMFGSDKGSDLAASLSGKIKTLFQMVGLILGIVDTYKFGEFFTKSLDMTIPALMINVGMTVCIAVAVLATAWSLIDYIVRFKEDVNVEE